VCLFPPVLQSKDHHGTTHPVFALATALLDTISFPLSIWKTPVPCSSSSCSSS
jgi:hypothetical protein